MVEYEQNLKIPSYIVALAAGDIKVKKINASKPEIYVISERNNVDNCVYDIEPAIE